MKFSKKYGEIPGFILTELDNLKFEMMAKGQPVYSFSAGIPDADPPLHVMRTLSDAAMDPKNYRYAVIDLPELLEAVIEWYARRYGVALSPDEITSLYGSQEGIAHICFPLCDPGDLVLVPDPGYQIFETGPELVGCEIAYMPMLAENDFLIDLDAIPEETARRAKMMFVSYPSNPVCSLASDDFYERLIAFAKKYDIIVLHDNAYSELVLDGPPAGSFLAYPGAKEVGFEINSLSKSFSMTGARVSFAIGNKEIIRRVKKFRSLIDFGIFMPIQKAAIAAISKESDSYLDALRADYREKSRALSRGLTEIGWPVPDAKATMFIWAPLPKGYTDSLAFSKLLLEKSGVIVVPGIGFGKHGEGFVRFALSQSLENTKKAVDAIKNSGVLTL